LRELPRILAGQWEQATQTLHSRKIESPSSPSAN
jgi:hypothetical protein